MHSWLTQDKKQKTRDLEQIDRLQDNDGRKLRYTGKEGIQSDRGESLTSVMNINEILR